jgi:hypothetical protein
MTQMGLACNYAQNFIVRKLFQFNKNVYLKRWAQRICFKTLLILFLFEAWEQMLKFTSFERQEINLVFKIKVFVVSKIWYFNKSIYFYFPKFGLLQKDD